ncbi:hypothetical protein BTR23_16895 [Alkalihalophilus pseudofirmus]|nr:hypothetical protein BTR23_16895 [Alkalihalophilus pseudofirmus]
MERMSTKVPENIIYKIKLNQLKENFVREGIEPKDMKRGNLALSKEGEIIVIDYGNFKKMK